MTLFMKKNTFYKWGLTKWYRVIYIINPSRSDFLIEVNGKNGFNPTERVSNLVYIWFQDKGTRAVVYCYGTGLKLFSVLGSMPWRHALLRI
jgi:hypothetical protein